MAQFYVKDKNDGLSEIGPTKQPAAKRKGSRSQKERQAETEPAKEQLTKKTRTTGPSIPPWSKKSLKQHVRKVMENLTLL